jgi:hypothetical protein
LARCVSRIVQDEIHELLVPICLGGKPGVEGEVAVTVGLVVVMAVVVLARRLPGQQGKTEETGTLADAA